MKTHLIFGLIALATMTGCTRNNTAIRQPTDDELFLRAKAKYERSLGSDYVVVTSVFVCATLDKVDSTKCDAAGVNTKLHPDTVEQGPLGIAYYHVKLTDGRTGYVKASEFDASVTFAELVECKRHGNPRVGMSAKQVVATCWGKPDHVDRRETARGVSERYVYVNGDHVILRNGIVTSVQTRGVLR